MAINLNLLLDLLKDEPARAAAARNTGQVATDLSERLVASYHPTYRRRQEKLLLIDTRAGQYVAVLPDEYEPLYRALGEIIKGGREG